MRPQVVHVVHPGIADLRVVEPLHDLLRRQAREDVHDDGLQCLAGGRPQRIRAEARIGLQLGHQEHAVAELRPLAFVLQAEHHLPAVARGERSVRIDRRVRGAGPRRRRGAVVRVVEREAHPLGHGFQHRDVDAAAAAGFRALEQRREDVAVGVHAGRDVDDGAAGLRGVFLRARDRQQPRLALDQQVVSLLVAIGTVGPVAGDVADDEARMRRAELVVRIAHAFCRAGREVLDEHVRRFEQLREDQLRLGMLQVEREAFLGAVGPDEVGRLAADAGVVAARRIADAGAFDLDDAGAEIGELARAERRGDDVFEGDDGDSVQGTHGWLQSGSGCGRPEAGRHTKGAYGSDARRDPEPADPRRPLRRQAGPAAGMIDRDVRTP